MNEPETVPTAQQNPNPLDANPLDLKVPIKVEVSEAEKEAFFRAFIRDEPYIHTAKLFDGKFLISFKGVTVADHDVLFAQVEADRTNGTDVLAASYMLRHQYYRMALSITNMGGKDYPQPVPTEADIKAGVLRPKKAASFFDKMPVAKVYAINEAFVDFERRVATLSSEVLNESFWKAAGSGS